MLPATSTRSYVRFSARRFRSPVGIRWTTEGVSAPAETPERLSRPKTATSFLAGSNRRYASGAVLSSLIVKVPTSLTLPSLSVAKNDSVVVPSLLMTTFVVAAFTVVDAIV